MSMNFRGVSKLTMVGEKALKHISRGMVCGHAKLGGRIQDFLFDFVYLLFIFIFFYYFENIKENII